MLMQLTAFSFALLRPCVCVFLGLMVVRGLEACTAHLRVEGNDAEQEGSVAEQEEYGLAESAQALQVACSMGHVCELLNILRCVCVYALWVMVQAPQHPQVFMCVCCMGHVCELLNILRCVCVYALWVMCASSSTSSGVYMSVCVCVCLYACPRACVCTVLGRKGMAVLLLERLILFVWQVGLDLLTPVCLLLRHSVSAIATKSASWNSRRAKRPLRMP